jgi:hypothetical protein
MAGILVFKTIVTNMWRVLMGRQMNNVSRGMENLRNKQKC